ncbi:MAG: ABC transporter substrate-binding protein [Actinomycetota bacterium]
MRIGRVLAVVAIAALVAAACGDAEDDADASASQGESGSSGADTATEPADTATEPADTPDAGGSDDGGSDDGASSSDSEPADGVEPAPAGLVVPEVDPVEFPLTITDAIGRELTLDEPARIGCYWTGCTEIFASLGVPPDAATVPGGTPEDGAFYFPVGPPDFVPSAFNDLEAWAGADINFVVGRGPQGPNDAVIEEFVDIFYLHAPGLTDTNLIGYDAHSENIRMLGQLLGMAQEAEVAVARMEAAIATLAEFSTPELADRSFAYLFNEEGYRVMTDDTPFCAAIAEAGVGTCLPLRDGELNAEAFLELDPDVIAVQAGFNAVGYTTETRDDPVWSRLTAVQNGTAYDSDDRLYWCCGSRSLIWALQDFAAYAIPDSGIPAPGPLGVFDPTTSPLVPQG